MSIDYQRLAVLLARYESDEPHVSSPDFDNEQDYYPEITWDELENYARMEHHGDCINQPCACVRCFADEVIHKARWIAERLDG